MYINPLYYKTNKLGTKFKQKKYILPSIPIWNYYLFRHIITLILIFDDHHPLVEYPAWILIKSFK